MLTVLALLVVGQGVVKTGILEIFSRHMLALSMGKIMDCHFNITCHCAVD